MKMVTTLILLTLSLNVLATTSSNAEKLRIIRETISKVSEIQFEAIQEAKDQPSSCRTSTRCTSDALEGPICSVELICDV